MVDADGWLRRALEPALAGDAILVARADTAIAALSACAARDPLCVVTELDLADHDGLRLARSLRGGSGPVAAVPLVLLADRPDAALCAAAIEAGVDVVLDRRGPLSDLRATVVALASMQRRLREDAARRLDRARADGRSRTAPSAQSGTRRRVVEPPGHAVHDVVVPSARPDPRAEPVEDVPTRVHVWRK